MTPPSAHLRSLRARVPGVRLFAPRVAVVLRTTDGRVLLEEGQLPAADVELESSLAAAARGILARLGLVGRHDLRPLAVRTGTAWQEEHDELGPLQPIWVVVEVDAGEAEPPRGLVAGPPPPLVTAPEDRGFLAAPAMDYIAAVRARIGHERIFYPWAGLALRDARGAVFLVRLAEGEQWHCPGGGVEPGETVAATAVRELEEETGLRARPGRLVGAWSAHLRSFANGDRIQGVATLLEGRLVGGRQRPDPAGEVDRAGWFTAADLPRLRAPWDARVRLVLTGRGERLG